MKNLRDTCQYYVLNRTRRKFRKSEMACIKFLYKPVKDFVNFLSNLIIWLRMFLSICDILKCKRKFLPKNVNIQKLKCKTRSKTLSRTEWSINNTHTHRTPKVVANRMCCVLGQKCYIIVTKTKILFHLVNITPILQCNAGSNFFEQKHPSNTHHAFVA